MSVTATANGTIGGPYNVVPTAAGAASANFSLTNNKAMATVTLSKLAQVYGSTPKPVSISTTPAGLTVDVTYDGVITAPTNVGTYSMVAPANDPVYPGTASGSLVITEESRKTYLPLGLRN